MQAENNYPPLPPISMNKRIVNRQNFTMLINYAIVCIWGLFRMAIPGESYQTILGVIISGVFGVLLLNSFKKYLKNFTAKKALKLTEWIMIVLISMVALVIITLFLEDTTGNTAQDDELGELFAGIMALLIGLPIVIFLVVITIKWGIAIKNIPDDFVGNLNTLGISILALLPVSLVLDLIASVEDILAINIISALIDSVPLIIMITIFHKAKKYNR